MILTICFNKIKIFYLYVQIVLQNNSLLSFKIKQKLLRKKLVMMDKILLHFLQKKRKIKVNGINLKAIKNKKISMIFLKKILIMLII